MAAQSIVAPLWLWLKLSLLHEFPFKDVPLGWRVDLVHSLHSVIVTHHVRPPVRPHPRALTSLRRNSSARA